MSESANLPPPGIDPKAYTFALARLTPCGSRQLGKLRTAGCNSRVSLDKE